MKMMNERHFTELQKKLKYRFKNKELLYIALSHSSYANEHKKSGLDSNERFEFLGDSILGLAVAELIFKHKSNITEGQMTKLRSELVCEKNLVALAKSLKLGNHILLGRGEEKGGGRNRPSILADAVEAIIAAIYLDRGYKHVLHFVRDKFFSNTEIANFETTDYKTALQEFIQTKPNQTVSYHVVGESGPDHKKLFTVEVRLNRKCLATGTGKSKKEAEQSAAMSALEVF
jgi:ribonuclease-3